MKPFRIQLSLVIKVISLHLLFYFEAKYSKKETKVYLSQTNDLLLFRYLQMKTVVEFLADY